MNFASIEYIIFLTVVFVIYWNISPRQGKSLLLAVSLFFYAAWNAWYLSLIIGVALVCWYAGLKVAAATDERHKRRWIAAAAVPSLLVLGVFKYFNFFSYSIADGLAAVGVSVDPFILHVLLPVGISFYTFQALSYVIDVKRGTLPPTGSFHDFLLYVAFFPQLVAGPIERAPRLLGQLARRQTVTTTDLKAGVSRILWGLFKKLVVADTLSMHVDAVYTDPTAFSGPALLLATVLFGFQIYCDFSAYSDIAIGSARLFGIHLMENFRSPYVATSVTEFWRRWHISLSTWLRDYVYVPLGGNRTSRPRWYLNILVTFFISGLWHGANWTFVVWGTLHGVTIVIERAIGWPTSGTPVAGAVPRALMLLRWLSTFSLVMCAWAFFRADLLTDALNLFAGLPTGWGSLTLHDVTAGVPADRIAIGLGMYMFVFVVEAGWCQNMDIGSRVAAMRVAPVSGVLMSLIFAIVLLGTFGSDAFIYFQF